MNFDFSDEQKAFGEQVGRMLAQTSPLSEARRALDGAISHGAAAWRGLADLGCLSILTPEAHGGLGLDGLELCVAAEAIGRALAPVPMLPSVYVCAEAIRLYGAPDQQARWLPRLADGTAIGTFAAAAESGTNAQGELRYSEGRLSGCKRPVPDGCIAHVAVVAAQSPSGMRLVLVELDAPDIRRTDLPNVDPSRPVAQIAFDQAAAQPLGEAGPAEWDHIRNRAAILLAFEQIGAADRALDMARDYALERKSFGRAIGSYQAIKHKLANVYANNQIARAHAYHGAWAMATRSQVLPLAAAAARISASTAFSFAAQENIQTHGGIGFTWEADCHLFYRRARQQALVLGPVAHWKARLLAALRAGMGDGGLG